MAHPARRSAAPAAELRRVISLRMLVYSLVLPMCFGAFGLIVSLAQASTANPETIATSPVADPSCLRLTFTFTGSSRITTTFPDRNLCDGGLVLVPGGTARRSGSGNKVASIPVRLLNLSTYTVRAPAKLVLAPTDRVVLVPSGGAASKVTPQNHDSLRASNRSWLWTAGSAGTVLAADSTASANLVFRTDLPAISVQLTFTVEAQPLSPAGWPLVFGVPTGLDTTLRVMVPLSSVEYLRRNIMLAFNPGVTDSSKAAFFTANQLVVLGVTDDGVFYIRTPDPGKSYSQYTALTQALRGSAGIYVVAPLVYKLEMESQQVSPGGWPLLTDGQPTLDTTSLVTVPDTDIILYRRDLLLIFDDSVSLQQQQAFFSTHNLTVLGVFNSLGWFYVRTPDPGPTYSQFEAFRARLRAASGTKFVNEVFFRGITPSINSRSPADSLNGPR